MYSDNKYHHVCTNEISYLTYFKNKKIQTNKRWAKKGQHKIKITEITM